MVTQAHLYCHTLFERKRNLKKDRIVYSTAWKEENQHTTQSKPNTVIIDYDQTLQLFLSQQERIEVDPLRMLTMVNGWVRAKAVRFTRSKRLRITGKRKVLCELTPGALNALSHWYYRNVKWQEEYPQASTILNKNYTVVVTV